MTNRAAPASPPVREVLALFLEPHHHAARAVDEALPEVLAELVLQEHDLPGSRQGHPCSVHGARHSVFSTLKIVFTTLKFVFSTLQIVFTTLKFVPLRAFLAVRTWAPTLRSIAALAGHSCAARSSRSRLDSGWKKSRVSNLLQGSERRGGRSRHRSELQV